MIDVTADGSRLPTSLAIAGLLVTALLGIFGTPPIDLHGPLHHLGIMDPLCGGTRSLRLVARGDLRDAWRFNPLGPILVLGALSLLARHAVGIATGSWVALRPLLSSRLVRRAVAGGLVVLWVNQQLHAQLLMRR